IFREKHRRRHVRRSPKGWGKRRCQDQKPSFAKHLASVPKCLAIAYHEFMQDPVDRILDQWRTEMPGIDPTPMAIIGRLSRAASAVESRLAETFKRHGLDASSFDVLATLRRSGSPFRVTPVALARDAMISTAAVAQRLNKLEKRGLI